MSTLSTALPKCIVIYKQCYNTADHIILFACPEGHISEYYYCNEHYGKVSQMEGVFQAGYLCPENNCNQYFTEILECDVTTTQYLERGFYDEL